MILQNDLNQFFLVDLIMIIINIILFLLFIVFIFRGQQRQRKAPYITFSILFAMIGNTLASLALDYNLLFFLGIFLVSVSFLFIFIHYEMISREMPNIFISSFLMGLNIAIFTLIINYSIYNLDGLLVYQIIRPLCSLCCINQNNTLIPLTIFIYFVLSILFPIHL